LLKHHFRSTGRVWNVGRFYFYFYFYYYNKKKAHTQLTAKQHTGLVGWASWSTHRCIWR
jgi:hypothetical protein